MLHNVRKPLKQETPCHFRLAIIRYVSTRTFKLGGILGPDLSLGSLMWLCFLLLGMGCGMWSAALRGFASMGFSFWVRPERRNLSSLPVAMTFARFLGPPAQVGDALQGLSG